jgi:hypothetical protein
MQLYCGGAQSFGWFVPFLHLCRSSVCEPLMWCYFCMLLARASAVGHSDELCGCKSVTPAFDHSAAEVLLLVGPLYFLNQKSVTPTFDRSVSGGSGKGNLAVM